MIKLIATIDSVRGIVQDRPDEIITIFNKKLDKHGRMTLYGAFSDLGSLKRAIESASALEQPVWVLGNELELEMALPYAKELFIIQVNAVLDAPEFFPHFEDKFYMESRKPIQEVNGLMYQCQVWKRDLTNLKDTWDFDFRDNF